MARLNVKHVATVFNVEAVEPCVKFWVDRFGFQAESQVPGAEGKLVFASVKQGEIEICTRRGPAFYIKDPGGNTVGFAQFAPPSK